MFLFRLLLVTIFLSILVSAQAAPLTLVAQGKPRAALVIAEDEPKAAKAAQKLQEYIARMSGATLPILKEGEALPAGVDTTVLVGRTAAAGKLGVAIPAGFDESISPKAFSEEGYVLHTSGNNLVVAGNSDGPYLGPVFAAYALLEKLGCRWYFPGEWGEIVPKKTTIVVPELNLTVRPDFAVRGIWLSGWLPVNAKERTIYADWGEKVGFSAGRMYPTAGDGFLAGLLPPKEYYEKHPEYFAMNKQGQRVASAKGDARHTMLCMSNPAVLTESINNLKLAFAGQKKLINVAGNGVGLSPPDGTPYCYCPECMAQSQNFMYPTYIHERMQSEEFFNFSAKIAEAFPHKWVATAGYALREIPPQGVKLPPNVQVMYAPISSCVLHAGDDPRCWRRLETMKLLKGWRKLTSHITIYDYNPGFLAGSFVPERDVANFTANAPLYKQLGIKGFNSEGRKGFMQTWISYYIRSRLMWDAAADVSALKREFYTTFFGPQAGPHVQAWWDACEAELNKATIHAHEDWLVNNVYTVDFTRKIHEHVEAARESTMTDEQRARFEAFALIADHLEAYAAMEEADKNLDYAKAAAAAGRMIEDLRKLQAINSFLFTVDEKGIMRHFFAGGRQKRYNELAAMTGGDKGALVAPLPLEMKFTRDRFNEGIIGEWHEPQFDDKNWSAKNTFFTWDAQDTPEDAAGHDYDGYGWYRATIDIPANFAGKPIRFWSGGAINEAWVWVNGEYAGHKAHRIWWRQPHEFELDVTKLLKPGKNTIAIRVLNDAEIGGLFRRGFFYSPKEQPAPAAPAAVPAGH